MVDFNKNLSKMYLNVHLHSYTLKRMKMAHIKNALVYQVGKLPKELKCSL